MKFILLILLISFGIQSIACGCDGSGTVKSSLECSDYVLYGKVIDTSFISVMETLDPLYKDSIDQTSHPLLIHDMILKSTFVIYKNYKGQVESDTVTIYTPAQSASCGYRFIPNEEFVIYGSSSSFMYQIVEGFPKQKLKGREKKGTVWTNHCTRTTQAVTSELTAIEECISQE